jgi:hypothetical protein
MLQYKDKDGKTLNGKITGNSCQSNYQKNKVVQLEIKLSLDK